MSKISSGISSLDGLIDSLYIGDNVVWEVDAGTSYDVFMQNFIRQSFDDSQRVIYVSFNRSPQTILNEISKILSPEHFILIDCFTSGKGKNDNTFLRFYENPTHLNIIRINNPKSIEEFTKTLNSIEDSFSFGVRYVFDSMTGMQDLWGNESDTYKFFTYMCPRLYDLGTVAYWFLEKDAHSQSFKANLRHITQVVFDLYKRRDKLYIKALKLNNRQDREAFKPHLYEIDDRDVIITFPRREPAGDIGNRIREIRTRLGISQKELADKIDLTPSFISQLESNQISPSLSSFLQICNALGVNPGQFLEDKKPGMTSWLIRKEMVFSSPASLENGVRVHNIIKDERFFAGIIIFQPGTTLNKHFSHHKTPEFIHVLKGEFFVTVEDRIERLRTGDSVYLKESLPSQWWNEGGEEAEILVVW
ncbi:MAG: helix-turn-helix domain-containing protein [Nitrospirae bacterium]|nr:helix-turn-helix domain-containing protein [Nitrospirota bacterium]